MSSTVQANTGQIVHKCLLSAPASNFIIAVTVVLMSAAVFNYGN